MAIGILEERLLTLAQAPGPGNLVVLFGSATGRDGIGGASVLASATFTHDDPSKRPSVQVGDPFSEKLLIEASHGFEDHHDHVHDDEDQEGDVDEAL